MELYQLSSLAKVFPKKIYGKSCKELLCAKGQEISYQIAYKGEGEYTFKIKSDLKKYIETYEIGFVPSKMPVYPTIDDGLYLHRKKGLFPDPLFPKKDKKINAGSKYGALWLNIKLPCDIEAGKYEITVEFSGNENKSTTLSVNVKDFCVKEKGLVFTQWFHTDCIADVHKVKVYSEKHFELIEKYIKMAVDNGINLLLIPVLTPPLDTEVGKERPTTQLVDISLINGKYAFCFSRFHRFIEIAKKCGVKNFEINHMFTQWGAKNAPKVVARVNGKKKKIFGWKTDAASKEYKDFLNALIPNVIRELLKAGISKENIYFHVSDEPGKDHLENYKSASETMKPLISGCKQIDALSNIEFYKDGLVQRPVVGIDHIEPFLNENVKNLWAYYCCAQNYLVSNRYFSMSSARTRIIGVQLYKYNIEGFLHWGYNFYNTQYSKKKINPYEVTDAGEAFPSGDAFSVYPYKNTVIPSLRLKVFKEALDDINLLYTLEGKIGREAVIKLIDRVAGGELTFNSYPNDEDFFKKLYKEIFKLLK